MALQNSQYDAWMRYYQQLQLRNKYALDERTEIAYHKIPRLAQIDKEIRSASLRKARLLLGESSGQDFNLEQHIQNLSNERTQLLLAHGFPADYLKLQYTCPICQDTGYVENKKCICFQKLISEQLYTQSNMRNLLEQASFDDFSLDYYPTDYVLKEHGPNARQAAASALEFSKQFVRSFDHKFQNLFFYGNTGVGKTFLSCCIAKELLDTMHSVIYHSAQHLFEIFSKNKFSQTEESLEENSYILNCDLLIIDDLGTELTNSFVASQLFLCVSERLLRQKSTIISTNLDMETFMEQYSERVFSRVYSNYTMINLFGDDIRFQKKRKQQKSMLKKN